MALTAGSPAVVGSNFFAPSPIEVDDFARASTSGLEALSKLARACCAGDVLPWSSPLPGLSFVWQLLACSFCGTQASVDFLLFDCWLCCAIVMPPTVSVPTARIPATQGWTNFDTDTPRAR